MTPLAVDGAMLVFPCEPLTGVRLTSWQTASIILALCFPPESRCQAIRCCSGVNCDSGRAWGFSEGNDGGATNWWHCGEVGSHLCPLAQSSALFSTESPSLGAILLEGVVGVSVEALVSDLHERLCSFEVIAERSFDY